MRADIFPLHTVLFPGQALPLHIFEERYRKMIRRVLDEGSAFGVNLIRQGQEALGPLAEIHPVGCLAKIVHVEILADGRMHLLAAGTDRFRILREDRSGASLAADIEILPQLQPGLQSDPRLDRIWQELETLALSNDRRLIDRPESDLDALYAAAALLEIPRFQKQALLEKNTYTELVDAVLYSLGRQKSLDDFVRRSAPPDDSGLS